MGIFSKLTYKLKSVVSLPGKLISNAGNIGEKIISVATVPIKMIDRVADVLAWYVSKRKEIKALIRDTGYAFKSSFRLCLAPFAPPLKLAAQALELLASGAEVITPTNPKDEEWIRRIKDRLLSWAEKIETAGKMQSLDNAVDPMIR